MLSYPGYEQAGTAGQQGKRYSNDQIIMDMVDLPKCQCCQRCRRITAETRLKLASLHSVNILGFSSYRYSIIQKEVVRQETDRNKT